jgi:hypothetical protein
MSHEFLISRRQSIFNFFANPGRSGHQHPVPTSTSQHWPSEARICLDLQNFLKCFVFWLSGPHGTSNFDHQSLIHSDLNYTTAQHLKMTGRTSVLWKIFV